MRNFNPPYAKFLTDEDRAQAEEFDVEAALAEARKQREAAGIPEFRRASGNCVCTTCGKEYWRHPYDTRYPIAPQVWLHPDRPEYILHLLCDGDLVKL